MLADTPYLYTALITIECATPLSIKADESDLSLDTLLVRDANGYPIIPGTSIAGVLRSIAKSEGQERHFSAKSEIEVSFGFIHNQNNQAMSGLVANTTGEVDGLLKNIAPMKRDQVALNEYGTAIDGAKLDRSAVPKGTRFSFELKYSSKESNPEQWQQILSWLSHPDFRLGGLTQRGFGAVEIIAINENHYNFTTSEDLQKWMNNRSEAQKTPFTAISGNSIQAPKSTEQNNQINFELQLEAEDFWRIGEGDFGINYPDAKLKPYTEATIDWKNGQANLNKRTLVIPASGIKGALRHRTLFHFRCLMNDFSDGVKSAKEAQYQNVALKALFGDSDNGNAQVGSFTLNDIYEIEGIKDSHGNIITKLMMHNKIDRFTGGTIDGALFSEELIYGGAFTLKGSIKRHSENNRDDKVDKFQSQQMLEAFKLALLDFAEGRLAIGGGSTKGHGYFNATQIDISELETAITQAEKDTPKQEASA